MFVEMDKGTVKGMFALGQNPAVGGQNAGFQRKALAKLEWLVVRDLYETETASFWKDSPEVRNGDLRTEDIQTEVFFLPASAAPEMDGSFTNTQRLAQWHEKAADPPGDARSDIWFTFHLGQRLKQVYGLPANPKLPSRSVLPSSIFSIGSAIAVGLAALFSFRVRRVNQLHPEEPGANSQEPEGEG